ncbi:MAG: hypothetical protein ACK4QL_11130 [Pseudanabaenaceae cyanobacterium]
MAANGYNKFYSHLHPHYRINDLYEWVFQDSTSSQFLRDYDSRFILSREYADLLEVRVAIYEQVQALHRLQSNISVLIGEDCPIVFAIDLVDYAEQKFMFKVKNQVQ